MHTAVVAFLGPGPVTWGTVVGVALVFVLALGGWILAFVNSARAGKYRRQVEEAQGYVREARALVDEWIRREQGRAPTPPPYPPPYPHPYREPAPRSADGDCPPPQPAPSTDPFIDRKTDLWRWRGQEAFACTECGGQTCSSPEYVVSGCKKTCNQKPGTPHLHVTCLTCKAIYTFASMRDGGPYKDRAAPVMPSEEAKTP